MTTKTTIADPTTEIKNYRKLDRLCFGERETKSLLLKGGAEKIYFAENCPKDVRTDIEQLCKLGQIPVLSLEVASDELGVLCRRQHTILVLGLRKG